MVRGVSALRSASIACQLGRVMIAGRHVADFRQGALPRSGTGAGR